MENNLSMEHVNYESESNLVYISVVLKDSIESNMWVLYYVWVLYLMCGFCTKVWVLYCMDV